MLYAGLLGLRKRFPIWRIGRAQTWMRGHLWLGFLGLPLILFHSGFEFGTGLTLVLMWLLVIVTASGAAGAVLQHYLPRLMMDRVPMETIYEQIPSVRAQLVEEADAIVASACGALEVEALAPASAAQAIAEDRVAGRTGLATVVRIEADDSAPLREFYLEEMRPFLLAPDAPYSLAEPHYSRQRFERLRTVLPSQFHPAAADLENICEEERQLSRQQRMHSFLHGWLLLHVPLSFALLALAFVHLVVALRY
jgi:hypothetical protein